MNNLLRTAAAAALALALAGAALPAVAATTPAPSPSASAGDNAVTWSITPATTDGPDGRVSARHELAAGASVSDYVTVTNLGATDASFDVYASDGVVGADGLFDLLPGDTAPTGGGSWITIGAENQPRVSLDVPAGQSVTVPYTITVPASATPGDHPAGLVASLTTGDAGVSLSSRVGVRVHLRVAGDLAPALAIQNVGTTWTPSWNPFQPGTLTVSYDVANTGNVRLGARTDAVVAGPFGLATTSGSSERREILPAQSARESITIEAWPLVVLTGQVTVTPSIVGTDQVPVVLERTPADVTAWVIPWSQLLLLLVLAGAVVLVVWWRRRSARRTQQRIDAGVAAARSEPNPA